MSEAMQRRLQQARQENPEADYANIIAISARSSTQMINERSMIAFADKYGFPLSKRLIDAEIAQIPGAKGLNGQVNDQSYRAFLAQQRLTDAQVREVLAVARPAVPAHSGRDRAHVPVGMATPYASMLLEQREGEAAVDPDGPVQGRPQAQRRAAPAILLANRERYMIPEQRALRIARIGPEQVAGVGASDQEIMAYYNANKATYAPSDTRIADPGRGTGPGDRERDRRGAPRPERPSPPPPRPRAPSGSHHAQRPDPAGLCGRRRRQGRGRGFRRRQGRHGRADPIRLRLGGGQGRFGEGRRRQDARAGASGNRGQAQRGQAQRRDRRAGRQGPERARRRQQFHRGRGCGQAAGDDHAADHGQRHVASRPSFKLAAGTRARYCKTGFEMAQNDPPEVVALAGDAGYAVVSPAQVVPAAPAPLASIRGAGRGRLDQRSGEQRARAAATQIAAKAAAGCRSPKR